MTQILDFNEFTLGKK